MRYRRHESGQAFTEFAIISPFLIIILFAFVDFGLYDMSGLALSNAVRGGARLAAVAPLAYSSANPAASGSVQSAVQNLEMIDTIPTSAISITYYLPGSGTTLTECGLYVATSNSFQPEPGYTQATCLIQGETVVTVAASTVYQPLTPVLSSIAGHGLTLNASFQMTLEQSS